MSRRTRPWLTALTIVLIVAVAVYPAFVPTLAPAGRGASVAGLQRGPGDGTAVAARSLRGDAGVAGDGIAGPATMGALDQFLARARAQGNGPMAARAPALASRPEHMLVLGYYNGDTPPARQSLARAGDSLDTVAAVAYRLGSDGTLSGAPFPDLMQWAQRHGKAVLAVVHNAGDSGFNGADVAALLADPAARDRAVEAIYSELVRSGYAGVQLDLENVPPPLQEQFTAFAGKVADRLRPAGLLTTVAVPARIGDLELWNDAYDYAALGRICDFVAVMAYDEHDPSGAPGPVAGLDWVQAVLDYAVRRVPPGRLLLGVAGYGYDWAGELGGAEALPGADAAALAGARGARIAWDDAAQEPWFRYVQDGAEHVVYFENAYSLAPKLQAAARAGVAGIALWRLGLEDPADWGRVAVARSGRGDGGSAARP